MPRLTDAEIEQGLASLTGWKRDAHLIRKQYTFRLVPRRARVSRAARVRLRGGGSSPRHHRRLQARHARLLDAQRRRHDGKGSRRARRRPIASPHHSSADLDLTVSRRRIDIHLEGRTCW